ncbi:casein kinase i isoform delta-like [Stylonychia lemnae]|uniref:Casein kinase I n=1 Tax=Stylonychia lemnae TaxID=5949 RepID=A0A078B5B4_STYLE|nr:casein kinase i isoform delta-like [Stylonychia lemnae]|eukprot:CDW88477.1 casein kinase i isoform delta-like [Stylonychia lemnae]
MPPVGEGRFGRVYRAKDYRTSKKVAIKVLPGQYKYQYNQEVQILQVINKNKLFGFLKLLDCGFENNQYYIVTELLGENLQQQMSKCTGKKFRFETAMRVAIQMFNRIRVLHKIGYVHRDIKLNNYVCSIQDEDQLKAGGNKKKNKIANKSQISNSVDDDGDDGMVFLIDYGITKKVENAELQKQIDQIKYGQTPLVPPARRKRNNLWAPISLLQQVNQKKNIHQMTLYLAMTFKDDLESLGYIIVSMITGTLPWRDISAVKLDENLDQLIKARNPKTLCQNLPNVQKLKSDENIKYKYFKGLLMHVYKKLTIPENYKYDWIIEEEKLKDIYFKSLTQNPGTNQNPQKLENMGTLQHQIHQQQDQKELSNQENPPISRNINIDIKVSDLSYNFKRERKSGPGGLSQFRNKRNISPLIIETRKKIQDQVQSSVPKSGTKKQYIKRFKKKVKHRKGIANDMQNNHIEVEDENGELLNEDQDQDQDEDLNSRRHESDSEEEKGQDGKFYLRIQKISSDQDEDNVSLQNIDESSDSQYIDPSPIPQKQNQHYRENQKQFSFLKDPQSQSSKMLKLVTGELDDLDIDEGERQFDCGIYVFQSPKCKIKDSKYQKFLDLRKEGKLPDFEVRIGGRVKKKETIQDKKKSMRIGPSSD